MTWRVECKLEQNDFRPLVKVCAFATVNSFCPNLIRPFAIMESVRPCELYFVKALLALIESAAADFLYYAR